MNEETYNHERAYFLKRVAELEDAVAAVDTLKTILLESEMPQTDEALIQAARNVCANEAFYREQAERLAAVERERDEALSKRYEFQTYRLTATELLQAAQGQWDERITAEAALAAYLHPTTQGDPPPERPWCQICGAELRGFYCDTCRDILATPPAPPETTKT